MVYSGLKFSLLMKRSRLRQRFVKDEAAAQWSRVATDFNGLELLHNDFDEKAWTGAARRVQ